MKQVRGKDTVVDSTLKEITRHGTEGFPFAVYLNDFSNFQTEGICWHWHDEVQVTLITEGEFLCQVGSEKVLMQPGEIMFFNSCALHQITPVVRAEGKLYSFIWRSELLGGPTESDLYQNCILPIMESHVKYAYWGLKHSQNKQLQTALRRIVRLTLEKQRFFELQVFRQLARVWMGICEYIDSDAIRSSETNLIARERDEDKIKTALAYIQTHYAEKLTLESIAKAAMTNRSELCKCFRRVLDTTPNEFLVRYRLDQSLTLLENPELRIADIADMTGFCSPSHFGTHFMKYMGCTPLQYRKTLSI